MNPSYCVILCDLGAIKIINLEYCNYFEKVFTKRSYLVRSSMAFKPNELVMATTMA
jgi:hypothetical protein